MADKDKDEVEQADDLRGTPYVFAVEIASRQNNPVMFHPNQARLRGRYSIANTPGMRAHEAMNSMPTEIPGQIVEVDVQNRTCRIFDALSLEQNKGIHDQIKRACSENRGYFGGSDLPEESKYIGQSDTDIRTWLYWMRRLVDAGNAVDIGTAGSGRRPLPSMNIINERMKGKIKISQFNSMVSRDITREGVAAHEESLNAG